MTLGGVAGAGVALDEAPGFRETLQPRPPDRHETDSNLDGTDWNCDGMGWNCDRVGSHRDGTG